MTAAVQETLLERATLARLFSLGFTAPSGELLDALRALEASLAPTAEEVVEPLGAVADALREADPEELAGDFEALFGESVRVSPYEASYVEGPIRGAREMADVAGFYAAFGAVAGGPAKERPDHVGCELEFLSFVLLKHATALEEGAGKDAAACAGVEDAFLRDHLGRWFPSFCLQVEEAELSPFYSALARLGRGFLAGELGRRGLETDPFPARPLSTPGDDEEFACGACAAAPRAGGIDDAAW